MAKKTCSNCGREKPGKEFSKDLSRKDGLSSRCRLCDGRKNKKFRDENPDKRAASKVLSYAKRRGAIGEGDREGKVTAEDYAIILDVFHNCCAYCDDPLTKANLTWDHVVPLSFGGRHDVENLVPACRPCNSSKGNKTLDEWYGRE